MDRIKSIANEYKVLFRSIPSLTVMIMAVAIVVMNLMTGKVIAQWGDLAIDGGILCSFVTFLVADVVTQRFGAKAASRLGVVTTLCNVGAVLLFGLVAALPCAYGPEESMAFDAIFSSTWFVLLDSTLAALMSCTLNSYINQAIGKLFKNPKGKIAYMCRSYGSTLLGQSIDNIVFYILTFYVFAPKYWGFGYDLSTCIVTAIGFAILELAMQVVFSPIGYRVCKRWERENVGSDYLDLVK